MTLSLDVHARRGDFALDVTVELGPGATGLLGANGAGKTTLLHVIAGLLPASGRVAVGGTVFQDGARVLPPEARQVGMVFQDLRLFPHLDVSGNLRYGARGPIDEAVALLGLQGLLARRPSALSGGEKQRVALARALVTRPRLLLLDEALASVDASTRAEVLPWLRRAIAQTAVPTLVVSHVLADLLQVADRLLVLEGGRVVGHGAPAELWADPAALGVVHGLGLDNVVPVEVDGEDRGTALASSAGCRLVLPLPPNPDMRRVAVRPEDILLATGPIGPTSARNVLEGRVVGLTPVAGRVAARIDVGFLLVAEVTRAAVDELGLEEGGAVRCLVKTSAFRWM